MTSSVSGATVTVMFGATTSSVTVTVAVADFSSSSFEVAVTVSVSAVSSTEIFSVPSALMVVLLLWLPESVQVTACVGSPSPVTVAVNFCETPRSSVMVAGSTVTPVTVAPLSSTRPRIAASSLMRACSTSNSFESSALMSA